MSPRQHPQSILFTAGRVEPQGSSSLFDVFDVREEKSPLAGVGLNLLNSCQEEGRPQAQSLGQASPHKELKPPFKVNILT